MYMYFLCGEKLAKKLILVLHEHFTKRVKVVSSAPKMYMYVIWKKNYWLHVHVLEQVTKEMKFLPLLYGILHVIAYQCILY